MLSGLCGMRLNTAGVVVGWVGFALSFIWVVLFGVALGHLDEITKYIMENVSDDPSATASAIRQGLLISIILYMTINLINLMASALLIAGTVKERHLLLVPWLMNSGLSLFFSAIYFVCFVFASITGGAPFGTVVLTLLSLGLSLFFHYIIWYAIYSLFKNIQASREEQQRLIHPCHSTGYPSYTKI